MRNQLGKKSVFLHLSCSLSAKSPTCEDYLGFSMSAIGGATPRPGAKIIKGLREI